MNGSTRTISRRLEGRGRLEGLSGAVLLLSLAAATCFTLLPSRLLPLPAAPIPLQPGTAAHSLLPSGVRFSGAVSQTKIIQGDSGEVYLKLTVTTPEMPVDNVVRSADTVVILDHSGSMAADNRLPYARRAIHNLIDRLSPEDRFALVVFDSSAQILSGLTKTTTDEKRRLHALVDGIATGSGTNISGGIQLARGILAGRGSERPQKIILLSDGEANEGITDPKKLAEITQSINRESATVSTIGMGLGFNEQLMASLADWGGGSFSYLEHLDKLAEILNRNLHDTRRLFAATSSIELALPAGVRVVDAGGYPVTTEDGAVKLHTGQLLSGSERQITLTLALPTATLGDIQPQRVAFEYGAGATLARLELPADAAKVTVVEPLRRDEAVASINQPLLKDSWLANNLGVLKQRIQSHVSKGDVMAAKKEVDSYRSKLQVAEAAAGAPISDDDMRNQLAGVERELADASNGSVSEQQEKRNRLGKSYLDAGRKAQGK